MVNYIELIFQSTIISTELLWKCQYTDYYRSYCI